MVSPQEALAMTKLGTLRSEAAALDARGASRRKLQLDVQASAGNLDANVLVHNISTSGLLIETGQLLEIGETIEVDLPHVGLTRANIVWSTSDFYGCKFASEISSAAVSSALLRSHPERLLDQEVASELAGFRGELTHFQKVALIFSLAISSLLAVFLIAIYVK
jgi:PilZ domain